VNKASHSVVIWSNFGQAIALKTGIFITAQKRVRTENVCRSRRCLTEMTEAEAAQFLSTSPMAPLENLSDKLENLSDTQFEDVYKACRRMTTPQFQKFKADKRVQLANDLRRKEEHVKEEEQREAKAVRRFKDRENFHVYISMEALQEELGATHESGPPKYTGHEMRHCLQLQYRRDCLSRCLTPGAMCSQFKGAPCERLKQLLKNFTVVCSDESALPSLLKPPYIRRKYTSHMFATALRAQLDRDRKDSSCTIFSASNVDAALI
jgi:hypothetical protein